MTKTSLDKTKIKILLLEGIHSSAVGEIPGGWLHQYRVPPEVPRRARISRAPRRTLISSGSVPPRNCASEFFESASRLTGVGCFCIGTNQVDLAAAEERGIPVFNAPFSNTRSVAELVLAEIILLMRGIPTQRAAHRGEWLKTATGSHEVRGKTLGIVGYGHIGTQVGVLAESLGMQVVFHDIETRLALGNARPAESLDALLGARMWSRCTCRRPRRRST